MPRTSRPSTLLLIPFLSLLTAFLAERPACASESGNATAEALVAADERRVNAMISGERTGLEMTLSSDLHYAHSNGVVDSRESLIAALESGELSYKEIVYTRREFSFPVPGVALMVGRARMEVARAGRHSPLQLSFLAVWRIENGFWRLLAWQSCPVPR